MSRSYLALLPTLFLIGCGGGSDGPTPIKKTTTETPAAGETAEVTPAPVVADAGSMTWDGSQGVAEVMGTVSFEGTAPERMLMDMGADELCHGEGTMDPTLIVNDGKMENVFVYVSKAPKSMTYPKGTGSVMLNQVGCMYEPHVLGLQKGQTLSISNGDDVTHNVHSFSKKNKVFNKSQPKGMDPINETFKRSEDQFAVRCDIHKWMSSFICVTDYPFFAVSAADGKYNLGKLPAGEYELTATHETLGKKTAMVTVSASGASTVDFSFKQ
jgi:plastocyanin